MNNETEGGVSLTSPDTNTPPKGNLNKSRSGKFIKNSVFGGLLFLVNLITTFAVRIIFIKRLGNEILGLSGVLSSIISTLSIVDLGIGTAIGFSLYKPLAENDKKKQAQIIRYFKSIYKIIGIVVFILGLLVLPFLPMITKNAFPLSFIVPAFLILLVKSSVSYFFAYNLSLIRADQKTYIISIIDSVFKMLTLGLQIVVMLVVENFIPYLLVSLIFSVIFDITMFLYVRKKYSHIVELKEEKLPEDEQKKIKSKISSMVFHSMGGHLIANADTIIISMVLGVLTVGFYSNYLVITATIASFIGNVFSGVTAAFGNILATESKDYVRKSFKNIRFLYFLMYTVVVAGVFSMAESFLQLWPVDGKLELLPKTFLAVFCLEVFISGYALPLTRLRCSAGVYEPDRWAPMTLVLLNIALSVPLAFWLGVTGVVIGTLACSIIRDVFIMPILAKRHIYGGTLREYYFRMVLDFFVMLVCATACWFVVGKIALPLTIGNFILNCIICVCVTVAITFAVHARTDEMRYFFTFAKKLFKRKGRKS